MEEVPRACVVVCKKMDGNYRFAVLKRVKNWEGWEIPKGHIEDGDSPEYTVYKELQEEAGIDRDDVVRVEPLDHTLEWTYERDGEKWKAVCECFLVEVSEDVYISVEQNPDDEHDKGHFLNFRDARDILTYDDQRELLVHAKEQLESA